MDIIGAPGLPPPIDTPEQAVHWAEELVRQVIAARVACDVDDGPATKRRIYTVYLMQHGSALGAIGALLRVGFLTPVAYNELVARVRATLLPTNLT